MDTKDINRLSEAVHGLDPRNDAHWNVAGFPNCNYLKDLTGINVQSSTLLAHGLQVARPEALKALEARMAPPPAADAGPEIQHPAAATGADVDTRAAPRDPPLEGPTWDPGTTLHRNKKATEALLNHVGGMLDILSRMTKKSGQARVAEKELQQLKPELERTLAKL